MFNVPDITQLPMRQSNHITITLDSPAASEPRPGQTSYAWQHRTYRRVHSKHEQMLELCNTGESYG